MKVALAGSLTMSLRELKQLACRELEIALPKPTNTTNTTNTAATGEEDFIDRVTLSVSGKRLGDDSDVEALEDGSTLVCFVRPRLVQHVVEAEEDVDADELAVDSLFRVKSSVPPRIRAFLLQTCRLPEWSVAPLTHVRLRQVVVFGLWVAMCKVASRHELGPPYLLGTLFYLMWTNFSKEERRPGEWSAYSLFNRGVRRIGGDNLRADVRTGGWFGF